MHVSLRCGKDIPSGDEQRCNNRPQHKAVNPKNRDATQSGKEHHVIRDPCVFSHQNRTQAIIHQADDQDEEIERVLANIDGLFENELAPLG